MTTATDVQRPATDPGVGTYRWDLDVLRILAILGVVSIHVNGLILGRPRLEGTPTWTYALIVDIGVTWCVPVFVMISGALLLSRSAHRKGAREFYRRRLVRLLPALVFWHVFYVVVVRMWLLGHSVTWPQLVVETIDAKVYTALYFLWLILGLYAVAPMLAAFLNEGGPRRAQWTAVALIAWTAVVVSAPVVAARFNESRPVSITAATMWVNYVGVFVAGYAFREPRATGRRWLWTGCAAVALMSFGVWNWATVEDHLWLTTLLPVGYTTPIVGVSAICVFVTVIDLCARVHPGQRVRRVLRALGEATFGVFLVHLAFLSVARVVAPDFYADPAPAAKAGLWAAIVVASFVTALLARRIPVVRRIF